MLWGIGGTDKNSRIDTEIIDFASGNSVTGPLLPLKKSKHCLVKVDDDTVVLIGGSSKVDGGAQKTVWTFDLNHLENPSAEWNREKDLNMDRVGHTCGAIQVGSSKLVVVTGGCDDAEDLLDEGNECDTKATELWIAGISWENWFDGPDMPKANHFASGVTFPRSDGDQFIVAGGRRTGVYSLSCATVDSCAWSTLEQTLTSQRKGAVAMLVPDSFAICIFNPIALPLPHFPDIFT